MRATRRTRNTCNNLTMRADATHGTAHFFCPNARVSLPVLRHLKVSIFCDMRKCFNVFNISSNNVLIVLKCLYNSDIMLTFRM